MCILRVSIYNALYYVSACNYTKMNKDRREEVEGIEIGKVERKGKNKIGTKKEKKRKEGRKEP